MPESLVTWIGTLVSIFPGVEFGPLYYRHLEWDEEMALTSLKDFRCECASVC